MKILDAISAVFMCGEETFMMQRQNYLKAFPGYLAFPGGKVDEGDEAFFVSHSMTKCFDKKQYGALVREVSEELGVDLNELVSKGVIESILDMGIAVSPDFNPVRFSTRFFQIRLKEKVDFKIDYNEASWAQWKTFGEFLKMYEEGKILVVSSILKVLREENDFNFSYDSNNHVPMIESLKGVKQFMPLSHTIMPAERTNAFLIGETLIDPSPRSDLELEKLRTSLRQIEIKKIMITHHHPDHHERSVQLAAELKVPLLMSLDTHQRIKSRWGKDYFAEVSVIHLKEGDVICKWLHQDVTIYEIPGHDEGHLGLAPLDLSWFIAGDLFQGVGTVVIGGDEGDMKKYFETLQKVIALNPRVIFPSHGIGLGGVAILERTLEHRCVRENRILKLIRDGLNEDEVLKEIYAGIDKELWPLARQNIRKHLDKLRAEKRLV